MKLIQGYRIPLGGGRTTASTHISAYLTAFILVVTFLTPGEAKEATGGDTLEYSHPVPLTVVARSPKPTDIRGYAEYAAENAGLAPSTIRDLIRCESEWKLDAKGDNGASHGILQFKVPTFELYSKKYGLDGYDIENPFNQIDLAALMIKDGYIYHWKNCGRKLGLIK